MHYTRSESLKPAKGGDTSIKGFKQNSKESKTNQKKQINFMGGNKMKMNKKGFTLIELLIVIAIIAILAAIAIPQFSAYRVRSYNSSAVSDLHSVTLQQAAMFADWQRFGPSFANAALPGPGGQGGAGAIVTGGVAVAPNIDGLSINDSSGIARGLQIPVGNNVRVVSHTDLAVAPAGPSSFTAGTKHTQGDAIYATDSDATLIYKNSVLAAPMIGYQMVAGDIPASTPNVDNIAALGVNWVKQ